MDYEIEMELQEKGKDCMERQVDEDMDHSLMLVTPLIPIATFVLVPSLDNSHAAACQ